MNKCIIHKIIYSSNFTAESEDENVEKSLTSDDGLITVVDGVLESDDVNKDGYVSFHEFMAGQGA